MFMNYFDAMSVLITMVKLNNQLTKHFLRASIHSCSCMKRYVFEKHDRQLFYLYSRS